MADVKPIKEPTESSAAAQAAVEFPEIMTIEQVAEYLQLHPQVVYRHVRAGTLPASRIGRTIRFKKTVLDAFLEKEAWAAAGNFMAFVDRQRTQGGAAEMIAEAETNAPQAEATQIESRQRRFSADVD